MARQGGPNHQLGRLLIPRFSDEDDIGILPQEGAQAGGKGQADLFIHLSLANEGQIKFNWVFQGEDGSFLGGKFAEGGVEGGSLARAGRTGDEDDPVGTIEEGTEFGLHFVGEA